MRNKSPNFVSILTKRKIPESAFNSVLFSLIRTKLILVIKALKSPRSPSWQPTSCSKAKEEKCLCLLKSGVINDVGKLFFLCLLLNMMALYDEG